VSRFLTGRISPATLQGPNPMKTWYLSSLEPVTLKKDEIVEAFYQELLWRA